MKIYFTLALRNLVKNAKRTALIGITLVISCTLLLFSFSIGNGVKRQILDKYRDFQSGDVAVVWGNVKKIDPGDPSRLFFSAFDLKKDRENREALRELEDFTRSRAGDIRDCFKAIRGNGMMDTGHYAAFSMIFGLSKEEANYLQEEKNLVLAAGELPFGQPYGICISDDAALEYGVGVGDWVTLDCNTAGGYVNTQEYQITGLYKSSSDFDSIYVYMTREDALELLDQEKAYFQSMRIFLKSPEQARQFAAELDRRLLQKGGVLRAEPMEDAAQFYSMIAVFLKALFTFFILFILFIIAMGIRSVIRMNLFERMKEFGTLRAIGFRRSQSFMIVFLEILLLSLACLGISLGISRLLVLSFENTGLYIGKGAVAYAIGGESIRPVFILSDTLTALLILSGFSLFAPLKPGLRLCCQKITDLLAQNQKPLSALVVLAGSVLKGGTRRKKVINVKLGGNL